VVAGNRKYLRTIYLDANRNVLPYRAEELYDLRQRPVEGNNLVNSPTYTRWLESGRADLQRFGGDDLLMSLPLIPRSRVWAGFNWTIDFGFPDGDRVLETSLTP
jgi:hypothetical protein